MFYQTGISIKTSKNRSICFVKQMGIMISIPSIVPCGDSGIDVMGKRYGRRLSVKSVI
jgi:hypothetical protein